MTCALMNIRPDNSVLGQSQTTYPNPLIDQLAGLFQLLRGASDGEDAHVGVGVRRWVSLELHVGTRLLFDVLDGFSTWGKQPVTHCIQLGLRLTAVFVISESTDTFISLRISENTERAHGGPTVQREVYHHKRHRKTILH